jgi:hypothetical protein
MKAVSDREGSTANNLYLGPIVISNEIGKIKAVFMETSYGTATTDPLASLLRG